MSDPAAAPDEVVPVLTARQQRVLAFIRDYIKTMGYPPTRFDISYEMGFKSLNAAQEHVRALERKGVIEIAPHIARGIRVKE